MIFPYLFRLLCLCSACFFLVHTALALVAWRVSPAALRLAAQIRPRPATRLLLALRLFPAALALVVVFGLCVPSYLWLEPDATGERVGFACFAAALLGATVWGISIARALRAIAGSLRYARHCQHVGSKTRLSEDSSPAFVIEEDFALLALAGVLRPRLVISRGVLRALSAEQFDTALRHERAHRFSRDNLKRLLLLLAPEVLPFSRGFAVLERGWSRFSEWAADDRAVEGDARRSLSLASALVRVARMSAAPRLSPVLMSLLAADRDLSVRVERLLRGQPPQEKPMGRVYALVGSASLLLAGFLAAGLARAETLYSVHRLLERLVH